MTPSFLGETLASMRTLHEIRDADGRSTVAAKIGVSEPHVSNVLNGVRGFTDDVWERALAAYPDLDIPGTLAERSRRREAREQSADAPEAA